MARFDWYQATVDEFPRVVTDALMAELPCAHSLAHGRGRQNYHHSTAVLSPAGDVLATVLHGGPNGSPNATASGERSDAFAAILRRHWPDAHRVSRIDSAEDVHGDFSALMLSCRTIGQAFRIKGHLIAPDDPEDGATYYLGATSSATRLRCYEKGKQLRATGEDAEARTDWVRLEMQLRPVREARTAAAGLSAGELWGVTGWTHRIASDVLSRAPDRHRTQARTKTTFERRNAALAHQYGDHLRDLWRRSGRDPAEFGAYVASLIDVGADAS